MKRLLLLLILLIPAGARGEIIDRIAAVVDTQVITLSEVDQVAQIRLLARREGEDDGAYRRRILDTMISHVLRYRDVTRFGAEEVPKDSIEATLTRVIGRFSSEEEFLETLARVELTLDEVRALIRRQLQVQAYVQERFAPLIFVSLDEIETYYAEVWAPQRAARGLPPAPVSDVREEIRNLIRADRLQDEIDAWTEQLRGRANVDVFVYE